MRRGLITNRRRLDLRLKLMELEMNDQASVSHYAKVIRDQLLVNNGYGGERELIDDHGEASLRPPKPLTCAQRRRLVTAQDADVPF
jgi:hypothetical protein